MLAHTMFGCPSTHERNVQSAMRAKRPGNDWMRIQADQCSTFTTERPPFHLHTRHTKVSRNSNCRTDFMVYVILLSFVCVMFATSETSIILLVRRDGCRRRRSLTFSFPPRAFASEYCDNRTDFRREKGGAMPISLLIIVSIFPPTKRYCIIAIMLERILRPGGMFASVVT